MDDLLQSLGTSGRGTHTRTRPVSGDPVTQGAAFGAAFDATSTDGTLPSSSVSGQNEAQASVPQISPLDSAQPRVQNDGPQILPDQRRGIDDGPLILPDQQRGADDGALILPDHKRNADVGPLILPDRRRGADDGPLILPDIASRTQQTTPETAVPPSATSTAINAQLAGEADVALTQTQTQRRAQDGPLILPTPNSGQPQSPGKPQMSRQIIDGPLILPAQQASDRTQPAGPLVLPGTVGDTGPSQTGGTLPTATNTAPPSSPNGVQPSPQPQTLPPAAESEVSLAGPPRTDGALGRPAHAATAIQPRADAGPVQSDTPNGTPARSGRAEAPLALPADPFRPPASQTTESPRPSTPTSLPQAQTQTSPDPRASASLASQPGATPQTTAAWTPSNPQPTTAAMQALQSATGADPKTADAARSPSTSTDALPVRTGGWTVAPANRPAPFVLAPTQSPAQSLTSQTVATALSELAADALSDLDFGLQAPLTNISTTALTPSVSLLSHAPSATAQVIAQQIASAMSGPTREVGSPVELALDPPELGRVRMQLAEIAGVMTLTIQAERPETADLMRRHLDLLAQEFAQAGLDAPSVHISQEGADQDGQDRRDRASDEATRQSTCPDADTPLPPSQRTASGGLDLRL